MPDTDLAMETGPEPDPDSDPSGLSARTVASLAHLGWSEDWSGDAPRVEAELRVLGFDPHPQALKFIGRFGGLYSFQESPYQPADGPAFHTDALAAAQDLDPARLRSHEDETRRRLCPLGQCGYGFYIILMDEEGWVYWLNEYDELNDWGHNARDLIEDLAAGIRREPLPRNESYPETYRKLRDATWRAMDDSASSPDGKPDCP